MIEFVRGNILEADVQALVNTVNCVGYMGRGIAAQFKHAFPDNFKAYQTTCKRGELRPGILFVFETGRLTSPQYIINFPTKRHWRGKSRIKDIEAGLSALVKEIQARGIGSIAVPPLGCGLGGLKWEEVKPLIEKTFASLHGVEVLVFEPLGTSATARISTSREVPKMTPGRAVLVGLIERYLAGSMDPFVSLLEVHKLMYFAQESGEQLRLQFVHAHYGPYAENLRHVLSAIEGHLISGYADGGDAPDKLLSLVPGAVEDAMEYLGKNPDSLRRFERVTNLLKGFETPYGTELLATVHWIVTREETDNMDDVVQAVHNWSVRKQSYTPRQIQLALQRLDSEGWIELAR